MFLFILDNQNGQYCIVNWPITSTIFLCLLIIHIPSKDFWCMIIEDTDESSIYTIFWAILLVYYYYFLNLSLDLIKLLTSLMIYVK